MTYKQILQKLKSLGNPKDVEGMARFGIKSDPGMIFGVRLPDMRKLAKTIGINHKLALELWATGYREGRILAGMIADIKKTDEKLMEKWIKDFDSWEICDETMMNLFWKSPIAFKKAIEWSKKEKEFEKRAGFALMACLAWKDEEAENDKFESFIPAIIDGVTDGRNFVKKAVNWAIRQIGKRNKILNKKFVQVSRDVAKLNSKSAKWIATDALRELTSDAVQKRLKR